MSYPSMYSLTKVCSRASIKPTICLIVTIALYRVDLTGAWMPLCAN